MADTWRDILTPNTLWQRVLVAIIVLCILNFVVFLIGTQILGGDAANGYAKNGHFYLKSHSQITEVSQGVFDYSLWHARSLFVTHPLAMIATGALYAYKKWWPRGPDR